MKDIYDGYEVHSLVESIITEKLEQGIPIICVMGPGDFTSTGHFVVMHKYESGISSTVYITF